MLCGTRNPAQLTDNAMAGGLVLPAADLERIRRDVLAMGAPATG